MARRFIGFLTVLVLPLTGRADAKPMTPALRPPWVCSADVSVKGESIHLELSTTRKIPPCAAAGEVPVTTGSPPKKVYEDWELTHIKAVHSTTVVDGTKVKVTRKDGKAINPNSLPALVRKGGKVLVVRDGKIDPYYLDVVSDRALVVTIPGDAPFADPTIQQPWVCAAEAFVSKSLVHLELSATRTKTRQSRALTSTIFAVVDGSKVKVTRKDGKAVDPKLLPALVRKGSKVLLFTEGEIDPYCLDVISDQTLIVTIPADKYFPFRTQMGTGFSSY